MEIQQFLQQLTMGLNQIEVKGQSVILLGYLMNLTNEYSNDLIKQKQQEEIVKQKESK